MSCHGLIAFLGGLLLDNDIRRLSGYFIDVTSSLTINSTIREKFTRNNTQQLIFIAACLHTKPLT